MTINKDMLIHRDGSNVLQKKKYQLQAGRGVNLVLVTGIK